MESGYQAGAGWRCAKFYLHTRFTTRALVHWTKTAEAVARQDGGAKREQGGVQSFMQGGVQSFICTLVLQLGGSRPNGEGFHRTKTAEAVSRRGDATVPSG